MRYIFRKWLTLVIFGMAAASLVGCHDRSTPPQQKIDNPETAELLSAIEHVRLEKARGNTLTGSTPKFDLELEQVLNRAEAAAYRLGHNEDDTRGLQELVRARDDFRNLPLLSEDNDVLGIFRNALDKALTAYLSQSGYTAAELGDPETYREIFSQTFNLTEKLGSFFSFTEMKTSRAAKLFEAGTCGNVCRNIEYVITDVNQNEAVWLLSPRLQLPDSDDLKLMMNGSIKGDIVANGKKGLRIYVSESFTGAFTSADDGWVDVTERLDRYPANGANTFRGFTANLWLDSYRGKSVVFAMRVQGLSTASTAIQFQKFTIMGKGFANTTSYRLAAPAPFELKESPQPEPIFQPVTNPEPKPVTGRLTSGFADCAIPSDGSAMTITQNCKVTFDRLEMISSLISYTDRTTPAPQSPFHKFNNGNRANQGSGWKGGSLPSCTGQVTAGMETALCVERSSRNGVTDLLLTPQLKLAEDVEIKVYYGYIGPTINQDNTHRMRALVVKNYNFNEATKLVELTDAMGQTAPLNAGQFNHDVVLEHYPSASMIAANDVKSDVMVISNESLSSKIGRDDTGVYLGLLLYLNNQPYEANLSSWFIYEIAFEKKN